MNFERSKVQMAGEGLFNAFNIEEWNKIKSPELKNKVFTIEEAQRLKEALLLDSKGHYYKGMISLSEAIFSVSRSQYSWATIKLYYSVFYFLRASLACNGYGFLRKQRELFHFSAKENESFLVSRDSTDHKATILLFVKLFSLDDKLQTNKINDENPYKWLMDKREHINYKYNTFLEPGMPEFWEEIHEITKEDKLNKWINRYLHDKNYDYCFLEEHACLSLPIKRMILTKKDMQNAGQSPVLDEEQQNCLKGILPSREKGVDLDILQILME